MVLAVVGDISASCLKNNENQCNFHLNRIVSTREQNIDVDDGTRVRRRNSNNHNSDHKHCRTFRTVLNNGESIQWWKLNRYHHRSHYVVKLLRKLCKFSGHLIKMRSQWFLLCLFLFCTHTTTLARPNADNNLHETNLAAVNFESTVSAYSFFFSFRFDIDF